MSTRSPISPGGVIPTSSPGGVENHGEQRRVSHEQRDEQQLAEDARRMRAQKEAPRSQNGAVAPPIAGKGSASPIHGGERSRLPSRLDVSLAIAHRLVMDKASGNRSSLAALSEDEDDTEKLDQREREPDRKPDSDPASPGVRRPEERHSEDTDSLPTSSAGQANTSAADTAGMPSPFSLFGSHSVPVSGPAQPSPALSHLDERLTTMARRVLVSEDQRGGPSVQLELDDVALPGVVVDMFEADGSIVAQFTSRDEDTHDHLASAAPWLAQSLASALQRDALVRVLVDSDVDSRPVEVRALPQGASLPPSPSH